MRTLRPSMENCGAHTLTFLPAMFAFAQLGPRSAPSIGRLFGTKQKVTI